MDRSHNGRGFRTSRTTSMRLVIAPPSLQGISTQQEKLLRIRQVTSRVEQVLIVPAPPMTALMFTNSTVWMMRLCIYDVEQTMERIAKGSMRPFATRKKDGLLYLVDFRGSYLAGGPAGQHQPPSQYSNSQYEQHDDKRWRHRMMSLCSE